jgi:hypothetical protein
MMASPGLNEITTTTLRNRKMKDKAGPKDALKSAQSGTHVPEKDFSSKKAQAKATGNGKPEKGSMAVAKSLPTEKATSAPVASDPKPHEVDVKKYQGSSEDWSQDWRGGKRKGMSAEDYDGTAKDRVEDAAGQRRFDADESEKVQHVPEYKKGVSAFNNSPKTSHGFGHPSSAKDGHLRNSGHSGAHRIGKKK